MTDPAWRASLRPGSFRGVAFFTPSSDFEGGRRGTVLEFPLQNDPKPQDLGLSARRYQVTAIVIGPEYHLAKRALIDALEQGGPGKLVHRYYGDMTAQVEPGQKFRVSESQDNGGQATFTIPFIRVPDAKPATIVLDTVTIVGQAADKAKTASIQSAAKKLLVDGPEYIRTHALDVLNRGILGVQGVNDQVTGALGGINQVNQTIKAFAGSAATLIATPGRLFELSQGGYGLHEAIFTATAEISYGFKKTIDAFSPDPRTVAREESRKIAIVTSLALKLGSAIGNDEAPITSLSVRAQQQAQNQAALVNLIQQSAVIEAARSVTSLDFDSNVAAANMRDQIALALIAQSEKCDDDDVFAALTELRVESSRHLTSVAGDAPRLRDFFLHKSLPALLVAHLAHGDATRAEEIISRNGIRHPGFVPGGYPVKIVVEA
jgi:prophage DNA circulation protein